MNVDLQAVCSYTLDEMLSNLQFKQPALPETLGSIREEFQLKYVRMQQEKGHCTVFNRWQTATTPRELRGSQPSLWQCDANDITLQMRFPEFLSCHVSCAIILIQIDMNLSYSLGKNLNRMDFHCLAKRRSSLNPSLLQTIPKKMNQISSFIAPKL